MYSTQQETYYQNGASSIQKWELLQGIQTQGSLELRKQDSFQSRVDCKFYWKTKIYNLEWII